MIWVCARAAAMAFQREGYKMQIAPETGIAGFVAGVDTEASVGRGLYKTRLKRVLDLVLAVLILPAMIPIILGLYIVTRRDGGPGFFGHTRVGQNGRAFKCWKIRTMVPDAQAVLAQHLADNPAAAAEWARDFKLDKDPRVTRVGRFLRSSSLDELPQLWNVIRGEMSFVGPRPVTTAELPKYSGHEASYLSVKPGITGLWQVSGRNDIDYDQRVRMDAAYVRSMSLQSDLSILARTVMVVLRRNGK